MKTLLISLKAIIADSLPPEEAISRPLFSLRPKVISNLSLVTHRQDFQLILTCAENERPETVATLKGILQSEGVEIQTDCDFGKFDFTKTPFFITPDPSERSRYNCHSVLLSDGRDGWDKAAAVLLVGVRKATVRRSTNETNVWVSIDLDGGDAICSVSTGIGFFDHLLEQLSRHGGIDLTVKASGDLQVDEHHTIEDVGITLGEALMKALGDKRGIERYGFCLPMDDCLCNVAIDFGGRPWLVWDAQFKREMVGGMPTEMLQHFFKSLSDAAKMNINISAQGDNEHHKAEGIFKCFAKALRMAVRRDPANLTLPTTKGTL